MRNAEIADAFAELADLYELDGAIVHRVLAYRNAATAIRSSGRSVAELAQAGRAEELPGVGKTIAEKIVDLLDTGEVPAAKRLKEKFPAGLVEITRLPGFGPKRARKLYDELGIASLDELRRAAETHVLRAVPGFGRKAEENVLAALEAADNGQGGRRALLPEALGIGEEIVAALREVPGSDRVEIAGSARRRAETCKDVDIVASAADPAALVDALSSLRVIAEVGTSGEAGARALTHSGMTVELRIVSPSSFGNLLQHLTGSGRHNELVRTEAVRRGLHVSEYGVSDDAAGTTHACATEEEIYALVGMSYIEPELREGRGELEAARGGTLPQLVRVEELRGDLHCHTVASDGRNTIEQMAAAALARGYEYLAITDHSATHGFGNHVSPDELRRQIERVREVDAQVEGLTLLAGSEVNVLPDGSLDYDDALLAELDWIVASLHTSFRMGERELTARMIHAMEHPLVDLIGHPTGRLIERREPYALAFERIVEAAVRTGTLLEINANPDRRDLNEHNARLAAESGAMLLIDSDAHGVNTLANIRYGVDTARRAWLTREHVANTRSWPELDALRKRSRAQASATTRPC
ncbi:MAG: DNA polymerase/3'-5' exonuclease PolX [Thermoleophilaceae bacterium]|nr:DNA polymerase/3'-5' exonuclease PolX [Thermoleophilaceae bacterium]